MRSRASKASPPERGGIDEISTDILVPLFDKTRFFRKYRFAAMSCT